MAPIEIVRSLHTLASTPANRQRVCRDQGCLPGLVMFLASPDDALVLLSLQTIELLVSEDNNRALVAGEPGMLQKLQRLSESSNADIARTASVALASAEIRSPFPEQSYHTPHKQPLRDATTSSNNDENCSSSNLNINNNSSSKVSKGNASTAKGKPANSHSGLGSLFSSTVSTQLSTARTHTLYVKKLNSEVQKKAIEEELLHTNGVISFWIDIYSQKVVVRALCAQDELVRAVKFAGYTAVDYFSKDSPTHAADKENAPDSPTYLDDAEEEKPGWFSITLFGSSSSTQKQATTAATGGQGEGWMGKLTSWW